MLLEFDERFAVFKDDFAFYDYKQPIKLDRKIQGSRNAEVMRINADSSQQPASKAPSTESSAILHF